MPLHRDIHWIGRQWAVTGHGVQLIDQKLQGFFDIEASKLWNDALIGSMYAKDWLNVADFEKALAIARTKYQQPASAPPPSAVTPRHDVAPPPVEPLPQSAKAEDPEAPEVEPRASVEPPPAIAELQTPAVTTSAEPPTPPLFEMQCAGRARFVRPWRVMVRKI